MTTLSDPVTLECWRCCTKDKAFQQPSHPDGCGTICHECYTRMFGKPSEPWQLGLGAKLIAYILEENGVMPGKLCEAGILRLLSDESADLQQVAAETLISLGEQVRDGVLTITASGLVKLT